MMKGVIAEEKANNVLLDGTMNDRNKTSNCNLKRSIKKKCIQTYYIPIWRKKPAIQFLGTSSKLVI